MTEAPPPMATAAHLTEALRCAGVLGAGEVRDVVVDSSRNTILSRITRLRLTYAGGDGPASLILKTALPERAGGTWNAGRHEVAFYRTVAAGMAEQLTPRCFEAEFDAETKAWHILLEDLGESHLIATAWPLPPTLPQCESIMRARARFQAAWWDHPRLGVSVGTRPDTASIARSVQNFSEAFPRLCDRLGDRLPAARRDLFERFIAAAPRLAARHARDRHVTILQWDAHVWNCFLPRDPASDDVRLFDWDGWGIGTGADDLAYMMAVHWYPDLRHEREQRLLDVFHAALNVEGYGRDALAHDYRVAVLCQIATPVWQAEYDIPPVIWWNNLHRILLAVDDLGCRELLN